jgi:NDP-4-keto-2,6-dideoxyhexose 3-C-methyltransferase
MNGLEIFDFEYNYTNGSSLRVYAGKTGRYRRKEHVDHEIESQRVFLDRNHLEFWFENTKQNMALLKDALQNFKAHGKKIGLIGASTKGNTTLMFSGLDNKVIDYALEVSPFKFDKYCLGSDIQILDEKLVMRTGKPDVLVAMVWHFKETFLKVFRDFINAGGVLVFPFPTPHMVTKDGTVELG